MRLRMSTTRKRVLPALCTVAMLSTGAEAATIIFENVSDDEIIGTVEYGGTAGPVIGTDIEFDQITGVGTPVNAGEALVCLGCVLNFQSGGFTSQFANVMSFGATDPTDPSDDFILTGTIPAQDIDGDLVDDIGPITGEILRGDILSLTVIDQTVSLNISAGGNDLKNEELVEFYFGAGFPLNFAFSQTEISANPGGFTGVPDADGFFYEGFGEEAAFNLPVTEADLTNTPGSIPEPGSALLLLMGLGSLAAYRRRRS